MTDYPLGAPLPAPVVSEEMQYRLSIRRSAPAQDLRVPGPDEAQIAAILKLGARSPDHGKMTPWRFVVLGPKSRAVIAEQLAVLAQTRGLSPKSAAVLAKLTAAPVSILVVSTAAPGLKPVWEQQLSAGAVCMNLEHAASAFGFYSSWITDWYSYDAEAAALFGVKAGEAIAGFIHIGSLNQPALERDRPDLAKLTTTLP